VTPGARLQAAIELLETLHAGTAPADRVIAAYFRNRRYVGGKDRRAVIDRFYAVLRRRAALDWWIERAGASGLPRDRARVLGSLALIDGWTLERIAADFDGGRYGPAPLSRAERALADALRAQPIHRPEQPRWVRLEYPAWLEPDLIEAFGDRLETEMAALTQPAALDLRVNALMADRAGAMAALAADGIEARPTALSPMGLRVEGRPNLAATASFRSGLVEVQDEGSQLVALLADARPGHRVVDFCAGAGGKTLAMAASMRNKGRIVACDVLAGRVERAGVRLRRAGVHNVTRRPLGGERDPWVRRHAGGFDRVLVDAPCSGTGTWRRNPDARWRIDADELGRLVRLQSAILASASRLVRPGGRLIYATCSLLASENEDQVTTFLESAPAFRTRPVAEVWSETVARLPGGGPCPTETAWLFLTPASHGTDGFFVAVMERQQ
jgi:16S rRNA (cytosine967-C5)-methyltransferase